MQVMCSAPMSRPKMWKLPEASKLKVIVGKSSRSRSSGHGHSKDGCGLSGPPDGSQLLGIACRMAWNTAVPTRMAATPESKSAAAPIGSIWLKSICRDRHGVRKLFAASALKPIARMLPYQSEVSDAYGADKKRTACAPSSRSSGPISNLGFSDPNSRRNVLGSSDGLVRQKWQKKPSMRFFLASSSSFRSSGHTESPRMPSLTSCARCAGTGRSSGDSTFAVRFRSSRGASLTLPAPKATTSRISSPATLKPSA
mmetsp:Transcript_170429/g.546474  ORF Transcript_170429/g.546474 Transcript_170429/m.546474 type:complete len:255 (+) Transcript_170429:583-1347(+)